MTQQIEAIAHLRRVTHSCEVQRAVSRLSERVWLPAFAGNTDGAAA
jgi:hypothetical protein